MNTLKAKEIKSYINQKKPSLIALKRHTVMNWQTTSSNVNANHCNITIIQQIGVRKQ
jgi:hypothetical protein